MNYKKIFSPWVYTTYNCNCGCNYCMVPSMGNLSMSSEKFDEMCIIGLKLVDKGAYNKVVFRLSGGEPFLAFNNYKDLVSKYIKEYPEKIGFGVLTNLTLLTDEMLDWLKLNDIGIQVSLDDLDTSKPFINGQSSSKIVMNNIEKLISYGIHFSINSVIDYANTKHISELANYICYLDKKVGMTWGLNGSYTLNEPTNVGSLIGLFEEAALILYGNDYDVYHKLRFYNMVLGSNSFGCSAGLDSIAIGPNFEMWSCQSLCDQKSIGFFDEYFYDLLKTSAENSYFYNRTMLKDCTDCSILQYCRGGCRAAHKDLECNRITCQIRRTVVNFILRKIPKYKQQQHNNCNNNLEMDKYIDYYQDKMKSNTVMTPKF